MSASITELGRRGACARLLAGTHFWNPPPRWSNAGDRQIVRQLEYLQETGSL